MKDSQFDHKSSLNLKNFAHFMHENPCFKNFITKSLNKELWSKESYFNASRETSKVVPINPKHKLLTAENSICENSRRSKSFALPFELNQSEILEDTDKISIKGYLQKKGKSGGLKKRLFYIKGSLMYYFIDSKSFTPKGVMYLPGKLYK